MTESDLGPRFLFTEPWKPVIVRRGDALGLRALSDRFADAIAPDLSNRVRDGRWVTVLAWCLVRSQEAFHASGGRGVITRSQQQGRYAWLRPLELMWVARTIALADDWQKRALAGQRRVAPWYESDFGQDRFGMSMDQFRAYRQTGMYGGYRLGFRKWPGMTVAGNGWTPGGATNGLAEWIDGKLGVARPSWRLHTGHTDGDGLSTRSAKLGSGDEHRWWLRHWKTFDQRSRDADENTLPRRRDDFSVLPEAGRLKPLIFGDEQNGKRRLQVAREIAKSSAGDHLELCKHLGAVFAAESVIARLPPFSRLADAGMAAMDLVAEALRGESHVPLSKVAAQPEAADVCAELVEAAKHWNAGSEMQLRHIETAHRFASAIQNGRPVDCLRALLQHHEIYGGGLRWFVLRNGRVEARTPPQTGSSRYRFRLWSLCRLAAQCGVIRTMPAVLRADAEATEEESDE